MTISSAERAAGLRRERMLASPRFRDGKFRNIHPIPTELQRGAVPMPPIHEFFFKRGARKPASPPPVLDPRSILETTPDSGLRATWLGHSTMLLEVDGARFLTDPVWGEQVSPFPFVSPKRFHRVPLEIEALPSLDAVLISHDHFDHLDKPSIKRLLRRDVPFVTSLGVGKYLAAWGVPEARIIELDWWEEVVIANVSIMATPSQHFSGRGIGPNATQWASLAIRGPRHSVFFSGDTGLTTQFQEIRERVGTFDLVMLEVGAFHPAWGDIHLGPENALTALSWLGGGCFLPVHWGTFDLALHAWDDPAEQLVALAPQRDVQLAMPRLGEPVEPIRVQGVAPKPWWRGVSEPARDEAHEEDVPASTPMAAPID